MNCKNCKTLVIDGAQYCGQCGQSTYDLNRPFTEVAKEMTHELLDTDGKLWLTFKTLVSKPGKLSKDFALGKRASYTPPLRLYLAISILFFVLFSGIYQVYGNSESLSPTMIDYYAKAMFLLFPIFALLTKLFFNKSYYINNLVFSMHIHSVVYLTLMIIAPLEALEHQHLIFLLLQLPPSLYLMWYMYTAYKTMFELSWFATLLRAGSVLFIYMGLLGFVFDVAFTYLM